MNAKERFNDIMQIIEEEVKEATLKDSEIMESIQEKHFLSIREINNIFPFLINNTLRNYIRERRLMNAYHSLLTESTWDTARKNAMYISQLYDQSEFSKKFKQQFNMTPKEAFKLKDEAMETPPLNWDVISNNNIEAHENNIESNQDNKFGINKDKLEKVVEAYEYQKFYGLSDELSNIAFDLSIEMNTDIKNAFDFVDDLNLNNQLYIINNSELFDLLKYAYFYIFDSFYAVNDVLSFVNEAIKNEVDIKKYNPMVFEFYKEGNYFPNSTIKEFVFLAEKYEELCLIEANLYTMSFEDYLCNLSLGYSLEDAAKEDFINDLLGKKGMILDLETEEDFNRDVAEAEMGIWNNEQFFYNTDNSEYDEEDSDNPYYSDSKDENDNYYDF